MQLTKDEKDYLKQLVKSKWFEVLEKISQEKRTNLLNQFMTADLWQEEIRHKIYWTQNFVNGMESLLRTAKWLTTDKVSKIESLR